MKVVPCSLIFCSRPLSITTTWEQRRFGLCYHNCGTMMHNDVNLVCFAAFNMYSIIGLSDDKSF